MPAKKNTEKDAPTLPGAQPPEEEEYTGPGARAVVGTPVVDPALADTEADAELAAEADEPMVVFRGKASKREITAQEWKRLANIEDMPTITWERRTGFKVPANAFTSQALQVLRQDPDFVVP